MWSTSDEVTLNEFGETTEIPPNDPGFTGQIRMTATSGDSAELGRDPILCYHVRASSPVCPK